MAQTDQLKFGDNPSSPRPRRLRWILVLVASLSFSAAADVIPDGALWVELPFDLVTGKPMVAVEVNGRPGRMLLDNGTPEKMMFNRDALSLPPGIETGRGRAASGQVIVVQRTQAPRVTVGGQPITLAPQVNTGNFGFVQEAFGPDYLGFIGTPFMQPYALMFDYSRRVVTFFRVDAAGNWPVAPPEAASLVADVHFSLFPGAQPTTAAVVGGIPMLLDFDTGDSGTLYLRPETRRALEATGQLEPDGERVVLSTLVFGGAQFSGVRLLVREAGSAEDFRVSGAANLLRLGSDFLAQHPSVWNFPGHRLSFLKPDSAFLKAR